MVFKIRIEPIAQNQCTMLGSTPVPKWYSGHVGDVFDVECGGVYAGCEYYRVVSGKHSGRFVIAGHAVKLEGATTSPSA